MKKLMDKYLWILVGLVVAGLVYFMGGKWTGQYLGVETTSPGPSKSAAAPVVKKSGNAGASPQAYTDMVKAYEGKRIQFDQNCRVTPSDITYKNGTSVMLDNRSGEARTVTVGGTKYPLAGYGYAIVNLSSPNLPKEMLVSCGSLINAGRIYLQAQIY